jgi:hypothetical protein
METTNTYGLTLSTQGCTRFYQRGMQQIPTFTSSTPRGKLSKQREITLKKKYF